jgi:hypothetical protein
MSSSVSKRPTIVKKTPPEPVASTSSGAPCRNRSTAKFYKFIGKDPSRINVLLARALLHDDLLDFFDGSQESASECVFSYPDSDWYSVYLIDADGNKIWDPEEGHMKLYFKINIDEATDPYIIEETMTNDIPPELIDPVTGMELENCKLSGSSCTGNRPKAPAAPKPAATPRGRPSSAASVPPLVSPSILAGLQNLTISEGAGPSRPSKGPEKITRDFFESMKSKDVIVDWMIKNMDRRDLLKCVEKGALSAAEVSEAETLADVEPSAGVTTEMVAAAEGMSESKFKELLKKAAKDAIKESLPKDSDSRKQAVIDLCTRAGITGYSIMKNKKGFLKIMDPDEEPVEEADINSLIDQCATSESARLKAVIDKLRKRYGRSEIIMEARRRVAKASDPLTLESIVNEIMAIGDLDAKKQAIVDLCVRSGNPNGYYAKKNKKGILKIYDSDNELVEDANIDGVLTECASLELARLNEERRSVAEVPVPETPAEAAEVAVTLESIVNEIMAIGDLDAKKQAIVDLCVRSGNPNGYYVKKNKKGILKIYDSDNELVEDANIDGVLTECASLELARLNGDSGFGKKRKSSQQNKFKLAAKKCKGKPNYRKCMSSALKKKRSLFGKAVKSGSRKRLVNGGSKYVSKTRKSPESSATTHKVGYSAVGNDGNEWVVKKASNGVKRWVKK